MFLVDLGALQGFVTGLLTLVVYAGIVAGIAKIFQISSQLSEMKDLLSDIKRNTQDYSAPKSPRTPQSPEELARALNAEAYRSIETSASPRD